MNGGTAKGELVLAIFEHANSFRHGWGVKKDPIAAKQVCNISIYRPSSFRELKDGEHEFTLCCTAILRAGGKRLIFNGCSICCGGREILHSFCGICLASPAVSMAKLVFAQMLDPESLFAGSKREKWSWECVEK